MALADLTDPEAVLKAIAEFDERGRDAFLDEYGFSPARDYFVVVDGKRYDSKAIIGVAHLYQHGVPLTAGMFSGGDSTVANRLEAQGFEVTRPARLPDWSVDELMLAFDLYLRTRREMSYSPTAKVVMDLSAELRSLRIFPDEVRSNPRFRNPSGVALKLHNFSSIDPDHEGQVMAHSGAGDRRVWEEWVHRSDELEQAVALIRTHGQSDQAPADTGEDEEYEAPEGRILFREHRRYERNRKLVAKKKAAVLKRTDASPARSVTSSHRRPTTSGASSTFTTSCRSTRWARASPRWTTWRWSDVPSGAPQAPADHHSGRAPSEEVLVTPVGRCRIRLDGGLAR